MAQEAPKWRVPQLVVAVAALVALGVGVPVGALLKAQVGGSLLAQEMHQMPPSGGSYTPPPDSSMHQMPPSGGSYTPPPETTCPDGTRVPAGSPCPQTAQPSGSQQYPAGSTAPTGGQCGSGAYWDPAANTCKPSTTNGQPTGGQCGSGAYWDHQTSSCKPATGTPSSGQPPAGTQCDWSKQYWDPQSNSCKAHTGQTGIPGQLGQPGTTGQPGTQCDWSKQYWDPQSNSCKEQTGQTGTPGQMPYPTDGGQFGMPNMGDFGQGQPSFGGQQGPFPFPGGFPGGFPFPGQTPFGGFPGGMMPPGGQGMGDMGGMGGGGEMGQHMPPQWTPPDFTQGCQPGDPFCSGGFDPRAVYEKYQGRFDMGPDMGPPEFTGAQATRELSMRKREAKMIARQLKEIDSMKSRLSKVSGGLACPVLVEIDAIASTIRSVVDEVNAATEDTENLGEILQKMGTLQGEIMPELGQLMSQVGMCEGAAHALKELTRIKSEVERECKSLSQQGEEYATLCTETLAALDAVAANPTEGCEDEFGFDPRCVFEDKIQPIMENFWPRLHEIGQKEWEESSCESVAHMAEELASFLEDDSSMGFDKGMLARAKKTAPIAYEIAKSAVESGDPRECEDAMHELERIGRQTFGSGGDRGGMGKGNMFESGSDKMMEKLISSEVEGVEGIDQEELLAKLEERILAKLEGKIALVEAAVQQQLGDMLLRFSDIADKVKEEVANALTASLDSLSGLKDAVRNEVLAVKNDLTTVANELVAQADTAELPKAIDTRVEEIVKVALTENLTQEASSEVKEKLDNLSTLIASTDVSDKTEAKALEAEVKEVEKEVKEILKENIADQVEQGFRPFKDEILSPDHFAFKHVAELKEEGIVKGRGTTGEFDPNSLVTANEMITMAVRAADLDERHAAVSAQGEADWAPTGTAQELGIREVTEAGENLAAPETRGEVAAVMVDLLDGLNVLDPDKVECDSEFKDVPESHEYAKEICILNRLGVMKGDAATDFTTARPDATVTRAEAATLLNRLIEATGNPDSVEAVFAE